VLQRGAGAAEGNDADYSEFRMCPFCRGTLKLIRSGGPMRLKTYQCLECREVTTTESETDNASYFDWLMSRPATKRVMVFSARPSSGRAFLIVLFQFSRFFG
jgi:hypothetical protein